MTNYSKLVGQIIGGIVGIAAGRGASWAVNFDPAYMDALAVLMGGAIGTYKAPANRPSLSS